MTEAIKIPKPLSGIKVFMYFSAFFMLVIAVNSVFIYQALHTNTGLVTEDAYKKGLKYNEVLDKAHHQPHWEDSVSFDNGVVRWSVHKSDGAALDGAKAQITFFRPVQDGMDFEMEMTENGKGRYEARPEFPAKGAWKAGLKIQWDNQNYQATYNLIVQ